MRVGFGGDGSLDSPAELPREENGLVCDLRGPVRTPSAVGPLLLHTRV